MRVTQLGTGAALLLVLATSGAGCVGRDLGVFEWEEYEDRGVTTMMPVAPPPPAGHRLVDVSVRELGATRTSGGEITSFRETGILPTRTDVAIASRPSRFLGIRIVGGLGAGDSIGGRPDVAFPSELPASGGVGLLAGWWGDETWTISFEVDTTLVLLSNRDQYRTVRGTCTEYPSLFGSTATCVASVRTDRLSFFEGWFAVPTVGATLDVAARPLPWLRFGAGASVTDLVSRDRRGEIAHAPVGVARVFVELYVDDVWLGLEAQQWVAENVTFAPALAVSVGGAAWDRPSARTEPAPEPEPRSAGSPLRIPMLSPGVP